MFPKQRKISERYLFYVKGCSDLIWQVYYFPKLVLRARINSLHLFDSVPHEVNSGQTLCVASLVSKYAFIFLPQFGAKFYLLSRPVAIFGS
ncbi:hypothetical protein Slin_0275 [Spirosoma linguale DSM 74]|uniref:Uncharacterized protein n=1 Tax=Spirosoma linguale (strain ATCC 33905 / DSM 74 / LMG 10896 / Claus 1) TaxID=504472 RepID=D2QDA9_SPILD|nr:hypothetical protein Slin_0275 [Spirosoma linguale DSM 74]